MLRKILEFPPSPRPRLYSSFRSSDLNCASKSFHFDAVPLRFPHHSCGYYWIPLSTLPLLHDVSSLRNRRIPKQMHSTRVPVPHCSPNFSAARCTNFLFPSYLTPSFFFFSVKLLVFRNACGPSFLAEDANSSPNPFFSHRAVFNGKRGIARISRQQPSSLSCFVLCGRPASNRNGRTLSRHHPILVCHFSQHASCPNIARRGLYQADTPIVHPPFLDSIGYAYSPNPPPERSLPPIPLYPARERPAECAISASCPYSVRNDLSPFFRVVFLFHPPLPTGDPAASGLKHF